MSATDHAELIEQLQRESRRWKRLATISTTILILFLAVGIIGGFQMIATAREQAMRAMEAERVARMAAEQAREEAHKELDQAKKAELDAKKVMYQLQIQLAEEAFAQAPK